MIEGIAGVEVDFGVMSDEDRQNLLTSLHGGPSEIAPCLSGRVEDSHHRRCERQGSGVGKSTVVVNLAAGAR